jgi:hypothetical protein
MFKDTVALRIPARFPAAFFVVAGRWCGVCWHGVGFAPMLMDQTYANYPLIDLFLILFYGENC